MCNYSFNCYAAVCATSSRWTWAWLLRAPIFQVENEPSVVGDIIRNAHHVKPFCDQDNFSSNKTQGYTSKSSRIDIVREKKRFHTNENAAGNIGLRYDVL